MLYLHACTSALTYLCLVLSIGQCFLVSDDFSSAAPPSFQLTVSPPAVKRDITHNVSLTCGHDGQTASPLQNISLMKIIRRSAAGWELVATQTAGNTTKIFDRNMAARGAIARNVHDSFLEVTWAVAKETTFGIYRCDVIGIGMSEHSSTLDLEEQPATLNDVLSLLLQTREEISELRRYTNRSLLDVDRKLEDLTDQALTLKSVAAWPDGSYALLQPRSGCPVDLTFMGSDGSHFSVHTESSSGPDNENSRSQVLPVSTTTKVGDAQFFTLRFCEARRSFGTSRWPSGNYCINKIFGQDCPYGFDEGTIFLDLEDTNTTYSYRGNVITAFGDRAVLEFCCKSSGFRDHSYRMRLPTHSPFLLYRKGNRCQAVEGMRVSVETMLIDTEDDNNGDRTSGAIPDIVSVNTRGNPVQFSLCHYTSS